MITLIIRWQIVLVAVLGLAAPTSAQETKLFLTSMSPAGTHNSRFFADLAERLTNAGNGALRVESRDGTTLANFGNIYQRVNDDVVQIGWALLPLLEGTFPLSTVGALPLVTDNPADGSTAFWRLYKLGTLDSEFKDVIPLCLMVHVPYQIHLTKAPKSFDDLGRVNIIAASKANASVVRALNGTPLSLDPGDIYQSIHRGLAGGTIISWTSVEPYKLDEVTTYHLEGPFGTTTSMLFMSRKKYESLPPTARKAIDSIGGEALSREFGKYLGDQAALSRKPLAASDKHTIKTLSDAEVKVLEPKLGPLVDEWVRAQAGRPDVLAKFRAIYADVRGKQ